MAKQKLHPKKCGPGRPCGAEPIALPIFGGFGHHSTSDRIRHFQAFVGNEARSFEAKPGTFLLNSNEAIAVVGIALPPRQKRISPRFPWRCVKYSRQIGCFPWEYSHFGLVLDRPLQIRGGIFVVLRETRSFLFCALDPSKNPCNFIEMHSLIRASQTTQTSRCKTQTAKTSQKINSQSGVAPANQTKDSAVRELLRTESRISSGTPFLRGFA